MKPYVKYSLISLFGILFIGTFIFLINKSCRTDSSYDIEKPEIRTITLKTMATGSIIPENEIEVKSRISGILEKTYVTSGDYVKKGQLIASLKIIPNTVNLNSALSDLKKAKINFENTRIELQRNEILYNIGNISEMEYKKYQVQFELAQVEYEAAENNLLLIKNGFSSNFSQVSNRVYAPIAGTVLDIPIKVGESIIESNTFNEGTTIAIIADMTMLIFEGYVVESEINKIKTGAEINIIIAAIENQSFSGVIDYISQKGEILEGSIQFKIRAPINMENKDIILRSGYSANAEIVLDKAENIISINEKNLIFKDNKSFVEVKTNENRFALQEVQTGLSDSIYIEIKRGLTIEDEIKVQPLYRVN
jgi:HlyD family secretion protein